MITKLFSLLMLKLTRLIVRLDTVRDAMHQGDLLWKEIEEANKGGESDVL